VARFYREVQATSQLSHPNVVHACDAGPIGKTHFLVMEYVEGIDLHDIIRRTGRLPEERARNYIVQAAHGLQHIHEHGLAHRDVKPSNLLLDQRVNHGASGLIKVLDLGLARLGHHGPGDITSRLTPVGSVTMGTPDFLAPEQALDFSRADIRADIYSLGCTFYFLLTSQAPFGDGPVAQTLLRHQQAEPPRVPGLSPVVERVLRRMMAKLPDQRFQTPAEVAAALTNQPVLPAAQILVSADTRPTFSLGRPRRLTRGRLTIALGILSGLALLIGIGIGILLLRQASVSPQAGLTVEATGHPSWATASGPSRATTGQSSAAAARGRNLVRNPGFEEGMTGWLPVSSATVVQVNAHSGTSAVQIKSESGAWQTIETPAVPNASYTLSAWGKVDDGAYAVVDYRLLNRHGETIADPKPTPAGAFGPNWSQQTITFRTTADTAQIRVTLWHSKGAGCLYVDDISLVKD